MRGKAGTGKSKKYTTVKEIKALATDRGWTKKKNSSYEDLRVIEQGVAKRARQVYTRMVKAGVLSPSMAGLERAQKVDRYGATFKAVKTGPGGDRAAVIRSIDNYINFLTGKSTGIKGAKSHLERTKETLREKGVEGVENLTFEQSVVLWKVIDEYRYKLDPNRFYETIEEVMNGIYNGLSLDELMNIASDLANPKNTEE